MRLFLKILMVVGMTILLLVPLLLIGSTIQDRKLYRNQVVQQVARSSAGAQSFQGPIINVPYSEIVDVEEKDAQGVTRHVRREHSDVWVFFPEAMNLDGTLVPKTRNIGLHEVRQYELQTRVVASFRLDIPNDALPDANRRIGTPWISYGIGDVRGLRGLQTLKIDGRDVELQQGYGVGERKGLHAMLPVPVPGQSLNVDTRFEATLEGMESLSISPLGKRNRIAIASTWPHPLFNGDFLPQSRTITGKGFQAVWEISSLATNAQAQYLQGALAPAVARAGAANGEYVESGEAISGIDAIGVSLVEPVNIYTQADRATKYGILFVMLTFVGFFMFEMMKRLRIHAIQYGLVGLALAIFFLLLLALSEHIRFEYAYAIASAACIGLIGFYVSSVLQSWKRGTGFSAMLVLLYAALYGLLISEDNAMVLGAGMLFLVLAAIMVVTRRIDWYSVDNAPPALPPQTHPTQTQPKPQSSSSAPPDMPSPAH